MRAGAFLAMLLRELCVLVCVLCRVFGRLGPSKNSLK